MARVTVEDCLKRVPNQFDLVIMACQRVRQLSAGAEPTLPRYRDKSTVLTLREIAEETMDPVALMASIRKRDEDEPHDQEAGTDPGEAPNAMRDPVPSRNRALPAIPAKKSQ